MAYFKDLNNGLKTSIKGLRLSLKHLWAARKSKVSHDINNPGYFKTQDGHVTLQYPHEKAFVPEIGRYQLDLEIDDCIVCDKCAKICPVDCIEIDAIKSPELIRTTSDGSPVRLHAATFNIDMAKCCFCGLCTTVCPTECLTMNSEYDYSVSDVDMLNFAFSNLSKTEADQKRKLYDQYVIEKAANKPEAKSVENIESQAKKAFTPAFRPKPVMNISSEVEKTTEKSTVEPFVPKFVPKFNPANKPDKSENNVEGNTDSNIEQPKFIPTFKPKMIVKANGQAVEIKTAEKPKFIPKFKPKNL